MSRGYSRRNRISTHAGHHFAYYNCKHTLMMLIIHQLTVITCTIMLSLQGTPTVADSRKAHTELKSHVRIDRGTVYLDNDSLMSSAS